jgi:hypothetical protein
MPALMDMQLVGLVALILALTISTIAMTLTFELHRCISITGTAFLSVFLMHGVTAIPLASGLIGQQYDLYPTPSPYYPWVVSASFIGFAAGAVVLATRSSFNVTHAQAVFARRPLRRGGIGRPTLLVVGVGVLVVGIFALPAGAAGLLTLAGQSPSAIYQFRQTSGEITGLLTYPISLFRGVVGPLLLLTTINVVRASERSERAAAIVVLIGVLIAVLLTTAASLQRAPVVFVLLFVLTGWFVSSSRYPARQLRTMAGLAAILLVAGAATYLATYSIDSAGAVRSVLDRIFLAPQQALDAFLHVYPSEIPFSGGAGIGLVARILGLTNYQSPALLAGLVSTGVPRIDLDCYWACDLWANFGYPGVVLGSFVVGGVMVSLDRWCLLGMKRTAAGSALYAFLLVQTLHVAGVSFFTMLLSGGLVLAPALAWALDAMGTTFRISAIARRLGLAG